MNLYDTPHGYHLLHHNDWQGRSWWGCELWLLRACPDYPAPDRLLTRPVPHQTSRYTNLVVPIGATDEEYAVDPRLALWIEARAGVSEWAWAPTPDQDQRHLPLAWPGPCSTARYGAGRRATHHDWPCAGRSAPARLHRPAHGAEGGCGVTDKPAIDSRITRVRFKHPAPGIHTESDPEWLPVALQMAEHGGQVEVWLSDYGEWFTLVEGPSWRLNTLRAAFAVDVEQVGRCQRCGRFTRGVACAECGPLIDREAVGL